MAKKINLSIIFKAVTIGVLILLMLIPLAFVEDTIQDRVSYKNEAKSKITNSWGGNLVIAAPILNVPYTYYEEAVNGVIQETAEVGKTIPVQIVKKTGYMQFSPNILNADVKVMTETRYIGIFEVPVYTAEVVIKGEFGDVAELEKDFVKDIKNAFVTLEMNEIKGINVPIMMWNGQEQSFEPNAMSGVALPYQNPESDYYYESQTKSSKMLSSKVYFKVGQNNAYELKFSVKGSEKISFIPLAKDNRFHMSSNWANPSFSGNFLPENREISENGFNADWSINYLASGISPRFDRSDISNAFFTTSFIVPVDNYRNAERALKYGFLFILLTFAVCFAFEVANKKPIHPIQYLLVGFAMVIFYALLVSISEFLSFGWAYLVASFATVALISLYAKFGIAKDINCKGLWTVIVSLAFLYGFLYVLLQLQDMALFVGSIGLFAMLGVIMYMTKDISWYEEQHV